MPSGVYKHSPNQGFQKGNKIVRKGPPWCKGKKLPPRNKKWCENISKAKKGCAKPKNAYKFPKGKDNPSYNSKLYGSKNHHWKGGYFSDKGYIYIYQPNHPFCSQDKYVRRSHLVIEKIIERYLTPKEVVHHINKIKNDDRPENLKLFPNNGEHRKFHKNTN